ncbi:MAG TPA: cobalt ECF transporter T component CbiQ [Anaerolineales bacterium]|nr:cobalt ECF transporter T component CbiQ [Anaerolineales bacterium]
MLHINLADQYRRGTSLIHRLDPRTKILAVLLFIVTATILPAGAWLPYGLLLAGALLAAQASGLGVGFALKRSFVALPFALAAITLPFTVPGQPLAHLSSLTITVEGSLRFLSILIKSWLSVQVAILLAVTTQFHELLWGMRELRLPKPLVSIVSFMYRYLFVFADEALRLLRARAARSGQGEGKSGGGLLWRGRVAGGMVGNLTLRAFERSERIYEAMVARGFQGEIKTLISPPLTDMDRNVLVGWVTYLAMLLLVGFLF